MTGLVCLRTHRLPLRPFEMADAEAVLDCASDAEWAKYLDNVPQPFTRRDAELRVARNVLAIDR